MATRFSYEWTVEVIAARETRKHERGEIIRSDFADSLAELLECADLPSDNIRIEIGLVCNDQKTGQRSWAYIDLYEGALNPFFRDSGDFPVRRVPAQFVQEARNSRKELDRVMDARRKACSRLF